MARRAPTGRCLALLGLSLLPGPGLARAQEEPASAAAPPRLELPPAAAAVVADVESPQARAEASGVVSPGLRVRLSGAQSTGGALRYRWVQTLGPAVELETLEGPETAFIVPAGASALGFLLMVGNTAGLDLAPVIVAVEGRGPGGAAAAALQADAGDDQTVVAGRQVTLNGLRSQPRGSLGYRWIQLAGPAVGPRVEEGYICTFVPAQPGLYRFALVVASGSAISEPDTVEVLVTAPATPPSTAGAAAVATPPASTADLARVAAAEVPGGLAVAPELARAFQEVADRLDLYESGGAMFLELSRRVETLLPADAAGRAAWVQRFCTPVTMRLAERLRASGLDATQPRALEVPLNPTQKDGLEDELRAVAAGLNRLNPRR